MDTSALGYIVGHTSWINFTRRCFTVRCFTVRWYTFKRGTLPIVDCPAWSTCLSGSHKDMCGSWWVALRRGNTWPRVRAALSGSSGSLGMQSSAKSCQTPTQRIHEHLTSLRWIVALGGGGWCVRLWKGTTGISAEGRQGLRIARKVVLVYLSTASLRTHPSVHSSVGVHSRASSLPWTRIGWRLTHWVWPSTETLWHEFAYGHCSISSDSVSACRLILPFRLWSRSSWREVLPSHGWHRRTVAGSSGVAMARLNLSSDGDVSPITHEPFGWQSVTKPMLVCRRTIPGRTSGSDTQIASKPCRVHRRECRRSRLTRASALVDLVEWRVYGRRSWQTSDSPSTGHLLT